MGTFGRISPEQEYRPPQPDSEELDSGQNEELNEYKNPEFLSLLTDLKKFLVEKGIGDKDDKDGSKPGYIYDTPQEILKIGDKNYDRYMCRVGIIDGVMRKIQSAIDLHSSPLGEDDIPMLQHCWNNLNQIATLDSSGKLRKHGGELKLTKDEVLQVKTYIQQASNIMEHAYGDTVNLYKNLIDRKSKASNA